MNKVRAEEIMSALGLAFNGYEYAMRVFDTGEVQAFAALDRLYQTFLSSRCMSAREEENWAIYFMLQRMLYKGGTGFFTPRDRDTTAAALFFLHLYTRDIPREYIFPDYIGHWTRIPVEEREAAARFVRRWLKGGSQKNPAAVN